jgi:hypothetical protein
MAPRQPVASWIEPGRRDEAEIDDADPAGRRLAEDEVAGAADAAHPRLDDAEREGGGDRRVDRVAPFAQDLGAGGGGEPVLRCDDAVTAGGGRLRDDPVLA